MGWYPTPTCGPAAEGLPRAAHLLRVCPRLVTIQQNQSRSQYASQDEVHLASQGEPTQAANGEPTALLLAVRAVSGPSTHQTFQAGWSGHAN